MVPPAHAARVGAGHVDLGGDADGAVARLFKDVSGLARRRVEVAAEQLLHTTDPVSQIGRAVGWPDQSYFARRFKAQFGLSATGYRKRFTGRARHIGDLPVGGSGRRHHER